MTHLLGIDYGTSQFKVQLYDLDGTQLARGAGAVPVNRAHPGWVEQDMEQGWRAVCRTIQEVVERAGIDPVSILAIGTTGTTNINLLDKSGGLLRPAILYGDERIPPESDIERIKTEFGAQRIGKEFGFEEMDDPTWIIILRLLPSSKLLWLRENEPLIFNQARACLASSWDFINARLTGTVSHWENTLEIDRMILADLDLPEDFFGTGIKAGEIAGFVTAEGGSECGLNAGTPVIMGVTDSLCSFLGAGINRPGIALNAAGTTDVVAASVAGRPNSAVGYPVQHLLNDLWLLSLSPVRGPTLNWFKDSLLPPGSTYADLDALAAQAEPGAAGLVCLPYFSGEKGLVHDPMARGMFIGFDLHHEPSHMARAGLEGIALSLRQILTAYRDQGVQWDELRLCGGGAKSEFWNQIKADILGTEIHVLGVLETGCLGAAMMASVAVGVHDELAAASETLSNVSRIVEPNPALKAMYDDSYQAFLTLYPAMSSSVETIHSLPSANTLGAN